MKDKIELMVLALMNNDEAQAEKLFSEIAEGMSMTVVSEMVGWERNSSPPEDLYSEDDMSRHGGDELHKATRAIAQRDPLVDSEDGDICVRVQEEGGPYGVLEITGTMSRYGDDYQFELDNAYLVDATGNQVKDETFAQLASKLVEDIYGWNYEQNMNAMLATIAQMRQYIQQRSA